MALLDSSQLSLNCSNSSSNSSAVRGRALILKVVPTPVMVDPHLQLPLLDLPVCQSPPPLLVPGLRLLAASETARIVHRLRSLIHRSPVPLHREPLPSAVMICLTRQQQQVVPAGAVDHQCRDQWTT